MTVNDDHRPTETGGFRLNFALIAALHLLVLGAVLFVAFFPSRKKDENVVWMNPGSFASGSPMSDGMDGGAQPDTAAGQKENLPPEPEPTLSPPPSIAPTPPPTPPEIPKDTPTPKPSVQVTPTPPPNLVTPKPTPSPKPSPSATPKPSPKPSLKPTPKSTPKPTPKASAKPSAKATPEESSTPKSRSGESLAHKSPSKKEEEKTAKNVPSPGVHKSENGGGSSDKPPKNNSSNGPNGSGTGSTPGNGDAGFGPYAEIIKNRFDGAWNQPHGQIPADSALVVTVHLKIEPDGTVTEFSIVDGSGNSVVDETVKEAGHKITRLPPPPGGSGFSPTIRFELRSD
jgi:TonB family protein